MIPVWVVWTIVALCSAHAIAHMLVDIAAEPAKSGSPPLGFLPPRPITYIGGYTGERKPGAIRPDGEELRRKLWFSQGMNASVPHGKPEQLATLPDWPDWYTRRGTPRENAAGPLPAPTEPETPPLRKKTK